MRVTVALSILTGIVLLLALLMPSRPDGRSLPTVNPLRLVRIAI